MLKREEARLVNSRIEAAHFLSISPKLLDKLLDAYSAEQLYVEFSIPKKSGGIRKIAAPQEPLKSVQQMVHRSLLRLHDEHIKDTELNPESPGHRPFITPVENALHHIGSRYVFNCDIKDFYRSITSGMLVQSLMDWHISPLSPFLANTIAMLACHRGVLPQGSPCSSILSEIVADRLDAKLTSIAKSHNCRYSRYVDDLTFSTISTEFPSSIGVRGDKQKPHWQIGLLLDKTILSEGFTVNNRKTRMFMIGVKQEVTGLTVNAKVSTSRHTRQLARAMADRLFKTGQYFVGECSRKQYTRFQETSDLRILEGILSHVCHIDSCAGSPVSTTRSKLYERFLLYKHFYASKKSWLIAAYDSLEMQMSIGIQSECRSFGGSEKSLALLRSGHAFARFSPAKATADRLGFRRDPASVISLISNILQAYQHFSHKRNASAKHLFVFGSQADYREWIQYMEAHHPELCLESLRKGWIKQTNLYASYLI